MATGTETSTVKVAVARSDGLIKYVDTTYGQSSAPLVTIPVTDLRNTTGLILTATEVAGGFNLAVASNSLLALGEVTDNETEASVCRAQCVLPAHYVAGTNLTVRLPVALIASASPTNNGSTIDLSVYEQAAGAVGSDLCITAAQTFTALDTWYDKDFTVTGAGLVPGDVLNLVITSSVIDSEAGGGTITLKMDAISVLGRINA